MEKYFSVLKDSPLFSGLTQDEFKKLIKCFNVKTALYKKGDVIVLAGNRIRDIGYIISGSVKIIKEDINGNISILTELSRGEIFADILVCAEIEYSPVTVMAKEKTSILFINNVKALNTCGNSCIYHIKFLKNMLTHTAQKSFLLNRKIEIISKRSIREKAMAFLNFIGKGKVQFKIPYNRQEMADYLLVDRSALSKELCKMRDEGLIEFNKNNFKILMCVDFNI